MYKDDYIKKFETYIFFSPHLDDAVLSCGLLLKRLKTMRKNIFVYSIFTRASNEPFTEQAVRFMASCSYKSAHQLFRDRKKEDVLATAYFGAGNKHLNFIDAAWRKTNFYNKHLRFAKLLEFIPHLTHVYPNATTQFSGNPSPLDDLLQIKLTQKLSKEVQRANRKTLLLAPLGVGGHVDHVITRLCVENLDKPILFWQDAPYSTSPQNVTRFFTKNKYYKPYIYIPDGIGDKTVGIAFYKSQLPALFPDRGVPSLPETYYLPH